MNKIILLSLILLIGLLLRFNNLNWDDDFHLHPDERFLTMVGVAAKVPQTLSNYLDSASSVINPANFGFKFFVYGIFPVTINKLVAVLLNNDTYNAFTTQGRGLAALADLLIIILIYKTVLLLEKKYKINSSIKYWASFFYSIAILPIQLSHFFTTDPFLNLFMFASFYFALRFNVGNGLDRSLRYVFLSAVFLGMALASKITAVYLLPLSLFLIAKNILKVDWKKIITLSVYLMVIYFSLRMFDPYIFQSNNFLNPSLSQVFVDNIKSLKSFDGADVWYPPGVQWIHKTPVIFSLINLSVFGVGLVYFIFVIFGIIKLIVSRKTEFMWIIGWVVLFFFYQSIQFVKSMRYFIFIYPYLAIFAAFGINWITGPVSNSLPPVLARPKRNVSLRAVGTLSSQHPLSFLPVPRFTFHVLLVFFLLLWPFMFSSIYINKHTRVEASEWIYKNIPGNSLILGEYWDDPLPIPVTQTYGKNFQVVQLPVFDPDTKDKWQKMNELLNKADYYILSSNRGWGSVTTVPEKYPKMSKFYNDLLVPCHPERSEGSSERSERNNASLDFSVASLLRNDTGCDNLVLGKYKFKKIKEFTSYPSLCFVFRALCFVTLPDTWSEEAFTVYDHPQVMIFAKQKK